MSALTAERVAAALDKPRRTSTGWLACCPAHEDRTPSLSISDVGDKVLVYCHAGCDQRAVLDAIEARGVHLNGTARTGGPPDTHATLGRASATWDYYDGDGRHVGRVLRFEKDGRKEIRQARYTGQAWEWRAMPEPRPIYRLREVQRRADATVLVTEGEKACDAAQRLFPGYVAVTWAGGAKAVTQSDWRPLAGRSVILWPDADVPGRTAMDTLSAILKSHGCTVQMVDLGAFGDVAEGWDAADCTTAQAMKFRTVPRVEQPIEAPDHTQWPADDWDGDPVDFLRHAAAPAFDANDVPPQLGRYACEWARAAGFDQSGVIAATVAAAASVLSDGLRLEVNPASEYYESARLWVALIGPPGMAKSPSIAAATGPIKAMHREAFEAWQTAQAKALADAERTDTPAEVPPRPALYSSDATIEALAELLVANPRGLLYLTDEFESWLGSHDAYRTGGSKDRGEWLRAYDGGPHQVDRIKRGAFFVPNWGVSILTATTPAALQKLSRKLPADGLLQRFIPVLLRAGGKADRNADVSMFAQAYYNTLVRLYQYGPGTGNVIVKMTPEAANLLHDERDRLRDLACAVDVFGDGFAGHVAKHAGMLSRIALIFHAVSDAGHPAERRVEVGTVRLASKFLRKAFQHAQVLYTDLLGTEGAVPLARAVANSLLADKRQEVARRDLTQSCHAWRKTDDERLRDQAMAFLVDARWLREETGGYNKPHVTRWTVNPAVHERFADYGNAHRAKRALVLETIRGGRRGE